MIDNIVIGKPLVTLDKLGITDSEETIWFPLDEETIFLPQVLKHVGLFNSTSEIKQINNQRLKSDKFTDKKEQILWRTIDEPEMTRFKVGKKIFWLIVGE